MCSRDVRLCVVEHMRWLMIDKYKSLKDITLKDLKEFADQFPQQLYVKGLVQGNYTEESALNVMNTLLTRLGCKAIQERQYVDDRTVQLPLGAHYIRAHALNEQDANTVITNYYQIGPNTVRLECILDLLMMFVEEPLFDQLRTKEQLGYHVGAIVRMNYGIAGYSIVVNSQETKTTASHVEKRIEVFRNQMLKILERMSQRDYDHTCDSLIKLKLVADMALATEVSRNWNEIINEEYMFDRRRQQIDVLRQLTKREILAFLLDNELNNMRKVSIQIIGHNSDIENTLLQKEAKARQGDVDAGIDMVNTETTDKALSEHVDKDETKQNEDKLKENANVPLEQLPKKFNIVFLPQDGDATTIVDIDEFKSNLDLYPSHAAIPQETARPDLIEDGLLNS